MTTGNSLRLGLTTWSADTDPFTREQMMETVDALEANACKFLQGVAASLPEASAEYENSFYLTTDTSPRLLYFCDGSDWRHVVETDNSTTERSSTGVIRVKNSGITLEKLASEVSADNGAFIKRSGTSDPMTGPLSLEDADPEHTYHAARKSYVDGPYLWLEGADNDQDFTTNSWKEVAFSGSVADTGGNWVSGERVISIKRTGVYMVSYTVAGERDSDALHRFRLRRKKLFGTATTNDSVDTITTTTPHGLSVNDQVEVWKTDNAALPAGLSVNTIYYVIASGLTTTQLKVSTSQGGSAVNITGSGTLNLSIENYDFEGPLFVPSRVGATSGTELVRMSGGHAIRALAGDRIALQFAPSANLTNCGVAVDLTMTWLHGAPSPYAG